jgi:type II secretory pathway predicted ATPase ExeA
MTGLGAYQSAAIGECNRVIANGQRLVMIVAPTAAGKTVIGAAITEATVADPQAENHQATSLKLPSHGIQVNERIARLVEPKGAAHARANP